MRLRDHTCRSLIFNGSDHPHIQIASTKMTMDRSGDYLEVSDTGKVNSMLLLAIYKHNLNRIEILKSIENRLTL